MIVTLESPRYCILHVWKPYPSAQLSIINPKQNQYSHSPRPWVPFNRPIFHIALRVLVDGTFIIPGIVLWMAQRIFIVAGKWVTLRVIISLRHRSGAGKGEERDEG